MTSSTKYSYLPLDYPILDTFYQKQKEVLWTPQEIDMSHDRYDWDKLNDNEKRFIEFILCFFAQADGIVIENLFENFQAETGQIKEARAFYAVQNFIETVHNETYSLLIDTFIRDAERKEMAFNAIDNYPSIKAISELIFKWMNKERPLTERIVAFCCVEGVLFSGAFAAIYWIKRKNLLSGLCKANEFIARDEAIHTTFGVALYHTFTGIRHDFPLLSQQRVFEIIDEFMNTSESFIRDALQVDMIGMCADDMVDYVKCTADVLCESLGYEKRYCKINPFDWMTIIGMPNKTNFFEDRPSEYAKSSSNDFTFKIDVDC